MAASPRDWLPSPQTHAPLRPLADYDIEILSGALPVLPPESAFSNRSRLAGLAGRMSIRLRSFVSSPDLPGHDSLARRKCPNGQCPNSPVLKLMTVHPSEPGPLR